MSLQAISCMHTHLQLAHGPNSDVCCIPQFLMPGALYTYALQVPQSIALFQQLYAGDLDVFAGSLDNIVQRFVQQQMSLGLSPYVCGTAHAGGIAVPVQYLSNHDASHACEARVQVTHMRCYEAIHA